MDKIYTYDELKETGIHDLRTILRNEFGGVPGVEKKEVLINQILDMQKKGIILPRSSRGRKPLKFVKVNDDSSDMIVADSGNEEKPTSFEEKGVFEDSPENYGFLRVVNYENSNRDIFVSPILIKRYGIRRGDYVFGLCSNGQNAKAAAMQTIYSINGIMPEQNVNHRNFDDLIPHYPTERYTLELKSAEDDFSIRCIDLFSPIGKGQRGLIVAPPKAGKTTLLKKIANSISANYPDVQLITLLIDERPEEVTDMRSSVSGEVVSSTFDELPEHHIKVSELVLARAKRLVEAGKDVVILLDSITKLARAHNAVIPSSGRTLSGGIDPTALQGPKKFFGAARNITSGGSLTIVATALVDTGSKMDEVIYEEFKGTGNMELHLSRELSERRIFPAIDIYRSGTRKEELLLTPEELNCANLLRKMLSDDRNASANMLDMMSKTKNNVEFVKRVPEWIKLVSLRK